MNHIRLAKCCMASYMCEDSIKALGFDQVWQICSAKTNCVAYMAIDHTRQEAVLIFRGTGSLDDLRTDFKVRQVVTDREQHIHRGFLARWHSLEKGVMRMVAGVPQGYCLSVTGHSLGAVLSCLFAVKEPSTACMEGRSPRYISQIVVFGSPRAGGPLFANELNTLPLVRYENQGDIVTNVPMLNYEHGGISVKLPHKLDGLNTFQQLISFFTLHSHKISTYVSRIERFKK